jgi:hypothetical protein
VLRRRWLAWAGALLALAVVPVPVTSAAGAADTVRASVDRVGWWSQTQGAGDPVTGPTPLGGLVPALPQSPFVPEDALPVAASLGEPQTEVAVGIVLEGAEPGATVRKLTMRLGLAEGSGAQQNDASAAIVACPITAFWGEADNGKWIDRPEADCETASAPGTRADDGSWTFDLTAIAALWLDSFASIPVNGIALLEAVDPPSTFQVAFSGAPADIVLAADISPAPPAADPFAVPSSGAAASFAPPSTGFDAPVTPLPEVAAPTPVEQPRSTPAPTPAVELGSTRVGDLLGNLPLGLLLLVPLGLVGAALMGRAVGGGRSAAGTGRRRAGVSRALAVRGLGRPVGGQP